MHAQGQYGHHLPIEQQLLSRRCQRNIAIFSENECNKHMQAEQQLTIALTYAPEAYTAESQFFLMQFFCLLLFPEAHTV